jgi:predicted nucleic acid binding AN1-type Zn finger protein
MEFYYIGQRCDLENCKQHDFLPFQCKYCKGTFCLEHRFFDNHNCKKKINSIIQHDNSKKIENPCIVCGKGSKIQIKCSKCNQYICLKHRHASNKLSKDSHNCY